MTENFSIGIFLEIRVYVYSLGITVSDISQIDSRDRFHDVHAKDR